MDDVDASTEFVPLLQELKYTIMKLNKLSTYKPTKDNKHLNKLNSLKIELLRSY